MKMERASLAVGPPPGWPPFLEDIILPAKENDDSVS